LDEFEASVVLREEGEEHGNTPAQQHAGQCTLHTCKHYITNRLHSEIVTHTIQFGGHNKATKIFGI